MSMPPIQLADPADSQAIRACILAAFAPSIASIEDFPDITHGLEDCFARDEVFVAKSDTEIMAAMTIEVHDTFLKIGVLAVNPAHKGRGLGRHFITFAEQHTRAIGLTEMRLRTHILMPQNVSLYEYLGWHVTSRDARGVNMSRHL